jgi:hypothetical protein
MTLGVLTRFCLLSKSDKLQIQYEKLKINEKKQQEMTCKLKAEQ